MMKTFTLILLAAITCPESLLSLEKPHHQLGWLGFLNLPERQLKTSRVVEVKRPKLWKQWDAKVVEKLDWLPHSEVNAPVISKGYVITFSDKKPESRLKSRRSKRVKSF